MAKNTINGLAERLKQAREKNNVIQRVVGQHLQRTSACVGMWESGKTEPQLAEIFKLAALYGVTVEWLLGLDAPSAAPKAPKAPNIAGGVPLLSSEAIVTSDASKALGHIHTMGTYPAGTAVAWTVNANSMAVTCASGDIVVIEHDVRPRQNDVYMVMPHDSESPILRRLDLYGDCPMFVPDAQTSSSYKADKVHIIGRVREVIRHRIIT